MKQGNFDKADDDISHTCAYTLAKRTIAIGGVNRMLYVIAVRGTYGGEWYSNFDFAPSHTDNGAFAENFLFAAEDVLIGIKDYVDISENPFIVATDTAAARLAQISCHFCLTAFTEGHLFPDIRLRLRRHIVTALKKNIRIYL